MRSANPQDWSQFADSWKGEQDRQTSPGRLFSKHGLTRCSCQRYVAPTDLPLLKVLQLGSRMYIVEERSTDAESALWA